MHNGPVHLRTSVPEYAPAKTHLADGIKVKCVDNYAFFVRMSIASTTPPVSSVINDDP